ncbi:MAG: MBL fold metallo-hydrolase [Sutterella sp.]|nr:MBL fold metallo-hydrolase [Sutterella sp.]
MVTLLKTLGVVLLVLVGAGGLWYLTTDEWGGSVTDAERARWSTLDHYRDGHFVNRPAPMPAAAANAPKISMTAWLSSVLFPPEGKQPRDPLPSVAFDTTRALRNVPGDVVVTWFGHSTLLLHMDTETILVDPVFTRASPVPLTGKPFATTNPYSAEHLPKVIDAVLLTHDHYDHLEVATIKTIKDRVGQFYCPLGVGNHLRAWGIPADRITELDWDEAAHLGTLTVRLTESRHFSGRTFQSRDTTLWGGYVIEGSQKLYISGDGGYGPHFKRIGDTYGPFDLAFMENGAYNAAWAAIHMTPEESAQAARDVRAARIVPIHWAKFDLAFHPWTEPIERLIKATVNPQETLLTPKIGESFLLSESGRVHEPWWRSVK